MTGRRLLVVEDNAMNQQVICGILASVGITPDVAESGQAAVEYAARNAYDLVRFLRMHSASLLRSSCVDLHGLSNAYS